MKKYTMVVATVALTSMTAIGQGTILWDESINGELSNTSDSPTSLTPVQAGMNSVIGNTQNQQVGNNWFSEADFFVITVPAGLEMSSIQLQVDKPNVWSWAGDRTYSSQLGFTANSASGELLAQWGVSALQSGTYGMYLANTDQSVSPSVADYRLDFYVQSIPEPSTSGLAIFGLCLLMARCKHRR